MRFKIIAGLAAAFALTPPASAQTSGAAAPATAPSPMELEAGVWDADIIFPSRGPGRPDTKAKGVQTNILRSGGMWMLNLFSVNGTPYEGTGIWGYDRQTGRYSGIWVDNNDKTIRLDDGRWDPKTQTMKWTAESVLPDGRHVHMEFTSEYRGDKRSFKMATLGREGEVPLVIVNFTRRPATAKP